MLMRTPKSVTENRCPAITRGGSCLCTGACMVPAAQRRGKASIITPLDANERLAEKYRRVTISASPDILVDVDAAVLQRLLADPELRATQSAGGRLRFRVRGS